MHLYNSVNSKSFNRRGGGKSKGYGFGTWGLGQYEALIPAVAAIAGKAINGKKKSGGGGGGGQPGVSVSPPITVSPAIQTQISPQISPVFQQTQSSPGAQQSASPTMRVTAPQTAETSGPGGFPEPYGSRRTKPFDEYGRPVDIELPSYQPIRQGPAQYQDLIKWGLIGAITIIGIKSFRKGRMPPKRKSKTIKGQYKRLS